MAEKGLYPEIPSEELRPGPSQGSPQGQGLQTQCSCMPPKKTIGSRFANFFLGPVPKDRDCLTERECLEQNKWRNRQISHHSKTMGGKAKREPVPPSARVSMDELDGSMFKATNDAGERWREFKEPGVQAMSMSERDTAEKVVLLALGGGTSSKKYQTLAQITQETVRGKRKRKPTVFELAIAGITGGKDKKAEDEPPVPIEMSDTDRPDGEFFSTNDAVAAAKRAVHDWEGKEKRQKGGFLGEFFDRAYKEDMNDEMEEYLSELDDHRPYFTYWLSFVQIVIFITAVAVYGIAPIHPTYKEVTGTILTTNLAIEKVGYQEMGNIWIGPRRDDLIHLGAKYSPCMRRDDKLNKVIEEDRTRESETACCVRNDGEGCFQASEKKCSNRLSTWYKWTGSGNDSVDGRTSGSVCGQDPRYCTNPASKPPFVWEDNISKWPLCKETLDTSQKHMSCEVFGRPCCVGIQGECIITTSEDCYFRKGFYHQNASLCSQVDCMDSVCGMLPFLDPQKPDQFYRLYISLFLCPGVFPLIVVLLFNFFIMRDVEKLIGWFRVAMIFLLSGITGSLASAIFLPYYVEAGPTGGNWGVMACMVVEVLQSWSFLEHPCKEVFKILGIFLLFLVIGFLPYIDNYAQVFGFIMGILVSFIFMPHFDFNSLDRRRKLIGIILCLITTVAILVILFVVFYLFPIDTCPYCHYFTCIPFTHNFCDSVEVKIERKFAEE